MSHRAAPKVNTAAEGRRYSSDTAMKPSTRHHLAQAGWLAAAALVLLGVFALYTRPAFLVTLVDQLWACF